MRWLATLATDAGAVALPLSDTSAQRLMAGLLSADPQRRRAELAAALANDPILAVWGLCRGAAAGCEDLRTVGQLSEWLANLPAADWLTPAGQSPACTRESGSRDDWADRAAVALGDAVLAARCAAQFAVSEERACLLGLAYRAPEWLATSPGQAASGLIGILPEWLVGARLAVLSANPETPTTPAQCVAMARRATDRLPASTGDLPPFEFDATAQRQIVAAARQAWMQESAAGEQFEFLLSKLAALEALQREFDRRLEIEKLDALKELAYGASHEINNPLANISARAQTLLAEETDPERRRTLATMNSQALRAHEMIADLMLFARPPQPKLERIDLAALMNGVIDELAPLAAAQDTQVIFEAPGEAVEACVDRTQLAVAVRALCANALEALCDGGTIELTLTRAKGAFPENFRTAHETVQITVADDGPGIPASVRSHLFDPFYSGREAGRGLGLGLSKCWRIVTSHGGRIEVHSAVGEGSRFTITLPVDVCR